MAPVSLTFRLSAFLAEALPNSDPAVITKAASMSDSMVRDLAKSGASVELEAIARAVVYALTTPGIDNPYRYAREIALNMTARDIEARIEAESDARFRESQASPRGVPMPEAIAQAVPGKPPSMTPEADAFAAMLTDALARRPDFLMVRVPGKPPVTESAHSMFMDSACLLYRSRGEGSAHMIRRGGESYPVSIRKGDEEWARQQAWAWLDLVGRAVEAMRSGRPIIPEIDNPHTFLVQNLISMRVRLGEIPPAPEESALRRSRRSAESAA